MNLDFEKVREIYGNSIINCLSSNVGRLTNNTKYLKQIGIENTEEVFELYPYAFLQEEKIFKEKVDNMTNYLGVDYIEKLDEDMTLWSSIDE